MQSNSQISKPLIFILKMSVLKKLREESGLTQSILAEKTGLSLRTIQRLEANHKAPKGYTLVVLAQEFNQNPSAFKALFLSKKEITESEKLSLKLLNLSVLAFFILPFGNLIVPFIIWRKKRGSELIDRVGRKILNFQIFWTFGLGFSLSISPFLDRGFWFSFPLILIVLFFALAINLGFFIHTANRIEKNRFDFLNLSLQLI